MEERCRDTLRFGHINPVGLSNPHVLVQLIEGLARANDHPDVVRVLGAPVRLGWLVTGQVHADETGWREFLLKIRVRGTRDHGALHVRAGRASRGAWTYTTLELEDDAGRRIDILAPPLLPGLPAGRPVYLVPLGPLEHVSVEELRHGMDVARHFGLACADVDGLRARLQAAGLATEDGRPAPWRRFFVHDPFGNRIEIHEPGGSRG